MNITAPTATRFTTDDARTLLAGLAAHWDAGDGPGYGRMFSPDATYVQFNGVLLNGRDEIADMHGLMFRTMLYGTRLVTHEIESVRPAGEDCVVVVSTGAALYPWQREVTPKRLSRQTLVLERDEDGRWLVTGFQNSRIKPFPTSGPVFEVAAKAVRMRVERARRRA
ncbi:SgcJ/EcaC family oxidoreductase [Streptomyces sp. SID5785]|uniref:SgcJ/EcaC family oxidoreductase n=1 Tax=Streptomyces sp. SID5785 TaxID=2690309 RepID=UPI0013610074|nr:SgcJ/EcaC family oxidoreductase [Streptomyces sp. SID5785]MZD06255.1 SgcJ/EcaC family oxidoreductase [Streptomyces sp. SID5785]